MPDADLAAIHQKLSDALARYEADGDGCGLFDDEDMIDAVREWDVARRAGEQEPGRHTRDESPAPAEPAPPTATPQNMATAINEACQAIGRLAMVYESEYDPWYERPEIARIRRELAALDQPTAPPTATPRPMLLETLVARVAALEATAKESGAGLESPPQLSEGSPTPGLGRLRPHAQSTSDHPLAETQDSTPRVSPELSPADVNMERYIDIVHSHGGHRETRGMIDWMNVADALRRLAADARAQLAEAQAGARRCSKLHIDCAEQLAEAQRELVEAGKGCRNMIERERHACERAEAAEAACNDFHRKHDAERDLRIAAEAREAALRAKVRGWMNDIRNMPGAEQILAEMRAASEEAK